MSIGKKFHDNMGTLLARPPTNSQSQRKLRPSNFKKLVENFDRTKDLHYHMTNIRRVIRAKHVNKWCTQFEGFGITLEGLALDWFRDIPKDAYANLEEMEPKFIEAFYLIGIKYNIVTKI